MAEKSPPLPTLRLAERRVAAMWAAELTGGANDLMSATAPRRLRLGDLAELLRPATI